MLPHHTAIRVEAVMNAEEKNWLTLYSSFLSPPVDAGATWPKDPMLANRLLNLFTLPSSRISCSPVPCKICKGPVTIPSQQGRGSTTLREPQPQVCARPCNIVMRYS